MASNVRQWRAEKVRKPRGTYWLLKTGRNADRVSLSLGYLTEGEADRARDRMNQAELDGNVGQVLRLHLEDPEGAVQYLVQDPGALSMLPSPVIDYGRMELREYYRDVFATARAKAVPKSWPNEQRHWRRILDDLGDVHLADMDSRVFVRWARDLRVETTGGARTGENAIQGGANRRFRPAAASYQRLLRAALQAALTHAYVEGHLEELVQLGEVQIRGGRKRTADEEVRPLSIDELAALIEASPPKGRAMWAVGAGEGLRPSELIRLQWVDVNFQARTLYLRGDAAGDGKTASSVATIPLTPLAGRELYRWWLATGRPTSGLVFPATPKGDAYSPGSTYKRLLAKCAEKAGIGRHVNPYLLRHSFVTIAWSLGIDADITRRIGRWTSDEMIRRVYCHPRPDELAERVAAFDWAGGEA